MNSIILISERPITDFKSKAEQKAKRYYLSCMDANETIESLGAIPMLDLLKKIGGWNITGDFKVSSWDLQEKLQILQNHYNMGGLFSWAVGEDDRNSNKHIIQVKWAQFYLYSDLKKKLKAQILLEKKSIVYKF